jgi:hypothetical protein
MEFYLGRVGLSARQDTHIDGQVDIDTFDGDKAIARVRGSRATSPRQN